MNLKIHNNLPIKTALFLIFLVSCSLAFSQEYPLKRYDDYKNDTEAHKEKVNKLLTVFVNVYESNYGKVQIERSFYLGNFERNLRKFEKVHNDSLMAQLDFSDTDVGYLVGFHESLITAGEKIVKREKVQDFLYQIGIIGESDTFFQSYFGKLIPNGSAVLEIGAGYSNLDLLCTSKGSEIEYYANEIYETAAEGRGAYYMDTVFQAERGNNYYSILGNDKSTGIETKKFDFIIMQSSLHHFKYPDAMFESIYKSCKPTKKIIVIEPDRVPFSLKDAIFGCRSFITKRKILQLFDNHRLTIDEKVKLDIGYYLYRLSVPKEKS